MFRVRARESCGARRRGQVWVAAILFGCWAAVACGQDMGPGVPPPPIPAPMPPVQTPPPLDPQSWEKLAEASKQNNAASFKDVANFPGPDAGVPAVHFLADLFNLAAVLAVGTLVLLLAVSLYMRWRPAADPRRLALSD